MADEEFIKQLREVFDLCDELKCGIISVKQLENIVSQHFSEEEVASLIECLDPQHHGVVTFADFCRGVQSTLQKKNADETPLRCPQLRSETNVTIHCPLPAGDADSAIATGSDVSRESLADKHDSGSEDIEENFTCIGHLSQPDNNSSGSYRSSGNPAPGRRRRSSRLLSRTSSKRLSSSALASQLHRNGSRRNSQSSDEMCPLDVPMSIEDDVLDLNHKVHELQQQVATLTESADERYNRVKQENIVLQKKIHSLEEQLRDLEIKSEDRVETEQLKFKEIMARCERESKLEVEQYASKLFSLQKEYMEMSEETLKLKSLIEKLKQEKQELQNQLLDCSTELLHLREDHLRLQDHFRREREELLTERTNNNKLLEELTKELEKQSESAPPDTRLRSPSLLELPAQYRELQHELRKVKDENKLILETNEELNAQLLANSLQEGRTLVNQDTPSLADEFDTLSKDEMMKALHEQKEVNAKLKSYIDGILLNILENHPQLLEVKNPL